MNYVLETLEVIKNNGGVYNKVTFEGKKYYTGVAVFNKELCNKLLKDTELNEFINRLSSPSHISKLEKSMVCSDWKITGQTIIIDEEGTLLDGGHRVKSVATSDKGIEFKSFFIIGVPTEMFKYIDQGKARTVGQVIEISKKGELKKARVDSGSLPKIDKLIDLYNMHKDGKSSDFYKEHRKGSTESVARQFEYIEPKLELLITTSTIVKQRQDKENNIRSSHGINRVKLPKNTETSLIALRVIVGCEGHDKFMDFLNKVLDHQELRSIFQDVRDGLIKEVKIGDTVCNSLAVTFIYIVNLYSKFDKNLLGKNLTQKKLCGVDCNIENISSEFM